MKFRKRPVVIEAMQLTAENLSEVCEWVGGEADVMTPYTEPAPQWLLIPTLEGNMKGSIGDWIIQGVHGEFYPCKPEIFEATYEPVEEA